MQSSRSSAAALVLLAIMGMASAQGDMGGMDMDGGMDMGGGDGDDHMVECAMKANMTMCESYIYNTTMTDMDIVKLCNAMSWMVGCTVRDWCAAGELSGSYCQPFSILGTICEDMPGMAGCENWKGLCKAPGSVVAQCADQTPMPSSPMSMPVRAAALTVCTDFPTVSGCVTPGCSSSACPAPIDTLGQACKDSAVAATDNCATYTMLCDGPAGSWAAPVCATAGSESTSGALGLTVGALVWAMAVVHAIAVVF